MWVSLLIIFSLCSVYYRWTRRRLYQLSKYVKCDVISLPIIGHAYLLSGGNTGIMKSFQRIGREAIKHGGITKMWLGHKLYIVLADVDMLEVVMKTCLEKDDIVKIITLGSDNGSIFAPVPIWRPRRKVLVPAFSPKNLTKFVDVFSKQSRIMVSQLKHAPKGSFSIWKYLTTYALDSVCETTLGFIANSQQNSDHQFIKHFEIMSQLIVDRGSKLWLHPLVVYKMTPQYATFMKLKASMSSFILQIIQKKRLQFMEERPTRNEILNERVNEKFKSFVELLIEASGENRLNDVELQEEAQVMVLAGTDTSAVGAAFTALMLSRHQNVQDKLYQEISEVFGDTDRPIVAEDLLRLKYLEAVIRESLRLYPPAPMTVRKVEKDVTLASGLTLVKGCGVLVHNWAVQRNPKYWGPDSDDFRPERFLEHYNTRAFMAFSSGPRNCLGYKYAMMSMKTVLASLIRQYRVLPAEEDIIHDGPNITYKPIVESFDFMMKDLNKFMIRIKSRK